ncbi:MAG: DUF1634 domain-containing protein [Chloroflexota bacterium]|nr:DUF1634 domain-containing protein [Chloroflexota bacterium]
MPRTSAAAGDELSRWVGGALLAGAAISIAVIAAGVLLGIGSITRAGVLLVVLTPMGHLAAAAVAFVRRRERRYAIAALVVLLLMVGGLAVAVLASQLGG